MNTGCFFTVHAPPSLNDPFKSKNDLPICDCRAKLVKYCFQEGKSMPSITLIEHDGASHTIDAEIGKSLMQNAIDNAVPGIDADCGGACACGTCHVFVEAAWLEPSGDSDAMEEAMLGMRPDRTEVSRLSCQIEVTDALEGMVVRLPEYQM
jgi:2Fe-2S ferredoxin